MSNVKNQKRDSTPSTSEQRERAYRVLFGKHEQDGVLYGPGDVVKSKKNLAKWDSEKFAEAGSSNDSYDGVTNETEDTLSSMTDEELSNLTKADEIDISKCSSREEIIQTIRRAQ